jgi:hypothetical protein
MCEMLGDVIESFSFQGMFTPEAHIHKSHIF